MSLDLSVTATRLLAKLASTDYVKLVRKSGGTYDPVTAEITGETETTINLTAAVLELPQKLLNNTDIKATDKYIIADNQTEPTLSDVISLDGYDYAIVMIKPINHAGIPQAYEIVARG